MTATTMFWPMLGMAALTFAAWLLMGLRRRKALRSREMRLDDFSGRGEIPMTPAVSVSTRHFANHFEIPLLFHVICAAHLALGVASVFAVAIAWAFVLLRALHMREHLGRNRVITRFNLYVASTFLMWLLWLHLAMQLLLD
ncbi:MAG: MAPEG family protein [Gammaproteobacteria bacterium]|jgi:hypothetical protein